MLLSNNSPNTKWVLRWYDTQMDSKHFRCAYQYPFDERMVEGPKCMDCSKTFNNITNAKAHYKYHHLVVRFVCHFCTDVSKTFQCLQHHFDAIHKPNMHVSSEYLVSQMEMNFYRINDIPFVQTKCVRSASMSTTNVVFPKKEERPEVSHSSTGKIASTERRRMVTRSDLAVTIDRIRKRQAGRVLHSSTSNTRLIERQRLDERSDLFVTNAHTDDNSMRKRSAEKVSHPQNSNRTSLKRRKIAWKIPKNDHRFEPSSLPAHYFTRIDEEGCVRVKEDELNDLDVTITLSDDE